MILDFHHKTKPFDIYLASSTSKYLYCITFKINFILSDVFFIINSVNIMIKSSSYNSSHFHRLEDEEGQKTVSCGSSPAQAPSSLELQPPQKHNTLKSPMVHSQTQIFSNKDNKILSDTKFLSTSRTNLTSKHSFNSKESPSSTQSSLSPRLTVAKRSNPDGSFPVSLGGVGRRCGVEGVSRGIRGSDIWVLVVIGWIL